MASNVGVPTKKKVLPPMFPVDDVPENLYMPKAEFVKRRVAMREAKAKAEAAYREEMNRQMGSPVNVELKLADGAVRKQRQLVATLTASLNELELELKDAAPGEVRSIKVQITKLKKKIEEAESMLRDVEEIYTKVKEQA